jgi:hypothetical protein
MSNRLSTVPSLLLIPKSRFESCPAPPGRPEASPALVGHVFDARGRARDGHGPAPRPRADARRRGYGRARPCWHPPRARLAGRCERCAGLGLAPSRARPHDVNGGPTGRPVLALADGLRLLCSGCSGFLNRVRRFDSCRGTATSRTGFVLGAGSSKRAFAELTFRLRPRRPTTAEPIYSIGISKRAMMPGSPPLASSSGSGSRVATHAYPCSG